MTDTSGSAAQVAREATRRIAPVERIRLVLAHSESMRELAFARLRARHPDLPTLVLVERLLGERLLGERLLPPAPPTS